MCFIAGIKTAKTENLSVVLTAFIGRPVIMATTDQSFLDLQIS